MDYDVQAEIYNDIGVAIVEQIGTVETKILVYVVNGEDGLDCSILYLDTDGRHTRSLPADNAVATSLFKLQLYLENLPAGKKWTAMEYWLDYGEVSITLSYDEIDQDVPHWERSPAVAKKYFPDFPSNAD